MSATLALFCSAIVAASLLGGAVPLGAALTHTRLQLYLSFSAGAMLGAAFFHMLPEAVEVGSAGSLRWTAAGLVALFLLERFLAYHHHESPDVPSDPCPTHPHVHAGDDSSSARRGGHAAGLVDATAPGRPGAGTKGTSLDWGVAALGLTAHTIVGGVALASAAAADSVEGQAGRPGLAAWGVFLATVLHKPADAMTIVSLMLRAGVPKATAHLVNLGFSLMIPAGVALFFLGLGIVGDDSGTGLTSATLAFSAGTFLCIALSDILPELQFHAHDRLKLSAALLAGLGLMAAATALEPPGPAPAATAGGR